MTRIFRLTAVTAVALTAMLSACSQDKSSPLGPTAAAEAPFEQSTLPDMYMDAAGVSESIITLIWAQVAGADEYEVMYMSAEAAYGTWSRQRGSGDVPGADLEGLESCTKFYLRVRALAADGSVLAISAVDSASTKCPAETEPNAPTNLIASVNEAHILSVAFLDNADNESGFELQYLDLTAYDFRWHTVTLPAQEGQFEVVPAEIHDLPAGHQFYVRVRALNSAGSSKFSNVCPGQTATEEADDDKLAATDDGRQRNDF